MRENESVHVENESVRSMDFVYKPERYGEAEE